MGVDTRLQADMVNLTFTGRVGGRGVWNETTNRYNYVVYLIIDYCFLGRLFVVGVGEWTARDPGGNCVGEYLLISFLRFVISQFLGSCSFGCSF